MTARRTKIDCCNGCTERQADPNCHGFCKKYLEQRAELDETLAEERKKQQISSGVTNQTYACLDKVTKRIHYRSKYRRPR